MIARVAEPALSVRNLYTKFETASGDVHAASDISFDVARGERLAIVGESGSGKSALAMSIVRLLAYPGKIVGGEVRIGGRDITAAKNKELNRVRGKDVGTIFQDPMSSLDPVMRISDQMIPPIMMHLGVDRQTAHDTAVAWLDRVGIPDASVRIRSYPFQLSGGMRQRVMIAMALSCNPSLVIADEPTTALDVTIQAQVIDVLSRLTSENGTAMLFITHDLGLVARFAHKVGVMYAGRMIELGTAEEVFSSPRHPYTQSLLRTIPDASAKRRSRLLQIPGLPPDLRVQLDGCPFEARCAASHELCRTSNPSPIVISTTHTSACWLPDGLGKNVTSKGSTPTGRRWQQSTNMARPAHDVMELNNLQKHFESKALLPWAKAHAIRAVNGVSLRLKKGETLGVVGESGCGKSTLARLILGLEQPTSGEIYLFGEAQMVFQDPSASFNPKMTVREIVEEPLVVRKKGRRAEREARIRHLLDKVGLEQSYLNRYPNQLSGGQRQRIGIARALALNPSVVVADEPTSALDISIRAQIINLLCDLKDELQISFVFISHDLLTVRYVSDYIAVMYLGEVVEYGDADSVFDRPAHPYTRALLDAIPMPDPVLEANRKIELLSGDLPSPMKVPTGCSFASRCPKATGKCTEEKPKLVNVSLNNQVACHFPSS